MQETVERILESLRPRLQMDGGDVELVEITADNVVKLRLTGACQGCPMSSVTLKMALEAEILRQVPSLRGVESV
ncbi:MAG: NifU family protein [Elusimicrobiota bacterium]